MGEPNWTQCSKEITIPAKPEVGLWTMVIEYICEDMLIKIQLAEATATWNYATTIKTAGCSPDGDFTSHIPDTNCLVKTAPPGCLVGKIGGSTVDEGLESFAIGSFGVYLVGKGKAGPLYLTINDEKSGFNDNVGEIRVNIFIAQRPSTGTNKTDDI